MSSFVSSGLARDRPHPQTARVSRKTRSAFRRYPGRDAQLQASQQTMPKWEMQRVKQPCPTSGRAPMAAMSSSSRARKPRNVSLSAGPFEHTGAHSPHNSSPASPLGILAGVSIFALWGYPQSVGIDNRAYHRPGAAEALHWRVDSTWSTLKLDHARPVNSGPVLYDFSKAHWYSTRAMPSNRLSPTSCRQMQFGK